MSPRTHEDSNHHALRESRSAEDNLQTIFRKRYAMRWIQIEILRRKLPGVITKQQNKRKVQVRVGQRFGGATMSFRRAASVRHITLRQTLTSASLRTEAVRIKRFRVAKGLRLVHGAVDEADRFPVSRHVVAAVRKSLLDCRKQGGCGQRVESSYFPGETINILEFLEHLKGNGTFGRMKFNFRQRAPARLLILSQRNNQTRE